MPSLRAFVKKKQLPVAMLVQDAGESRSVCKASGVLQLWTASTAGYWKKHT